MGPANAPTRWQRFGHLAVAVLLALGFSLTLAIFVEGRFARPRCQAYGAPRQLAYVSLEYPSAPPGIPGRRAAACLFLSADRQVVTAPFRDVTSSAVIDLLVGLGTTPLVTTPLLLALLVFGLQRLYGVLGDGRA